MSDLAVLFLHLVAILIRLVGPGGAPAVVAESVLIKHQLLILNRSRRRSPNLRLADRVVAGVCTLLMRPSRLVRACGSPKDGPHIIGVLSGGPGSIDKGHSRRVPGWISSAECLIRHSSRRARQHRGRRD